MEVTDPVKYVSLSAGEQELAREAHLRLMQGPNVCPHCGAALRGSPSAAAPASTAAPHGTAP